MSVDGNHMICLVCGRTLEQVIDRLYGDAKTVGYQHSMMDFDADHPPVAARPDDVPAQVKYRCDFCLEEPVTHTLVVDRETHIPAINMRYDMEWTLCRPCAELALGNDWINLRRRAFAKADERVEGGFGEAGKTDMRIVYRDLRDHVVMFYEEPAR